MVAACYIMLCSERCDQFFPKATLKVLANANLVDVIVVRDFLILNEIVASESSNPVCH